MTIRAHRSRLIWSPLVGWALLSCGMSAVHAQSPTQTGDDPAAVAPIDPSSVTPALPPGGAVPGVFTQTGVDDTLRREAARRAGTTLPDSTLVAPTVPSAGTTIVNSPFGTSIPYYGGIVGGGLGLVGSSGGGLVSDGGGIAVGAFILVPQIEINVGFDSNVYAQSASLGTTGSLYTSVTPTLDLRSDWLNHSLHVLASGTIGWYGVAPTQNYQNYGILVDGKIDIHSDFHATYAVGFRRATQPLGTPNAAIAQSPTVIDTLPIEIGLYQKFDRVFYQITAMAARYWYQNYSLISSEDLPAASLDRFEFGQSFKLGYQLFEDLSVFVAPTFNQIRYIDTINAAGQARSSNGMNISFGATWQVNAISLLEGTIGYQNTGFEYGLGNTGALSFGLIGTFTGYAPLTLRPYILRSINQSILSQYSDYVSTTIAVDYTYLIHDAWTLAGGLLFQSADYTPIAGTGAGPRTDYYFRGQIGLLYSIRPDIQIGPFFEYAHASSTNVLGPSYDRQIYSIRLLAKR
ncbi:MAG: outer membrane beta-barrel protein [Enhydrobacter sp.]|nr:outer membrane beta-barrel protein [Enhydrobacter sp.]